MRMVDEDIQPGQRWVSDAEPELGLGVVMSAGNGRVSILFPAADDRREYALDSAPVRRVAFEVGDNVKTHDGISGSIEEVKEEGGFLHYQVKGEWIPEAVLADTISFSSPLDRLMGRQLDEPHLFNVRNEALTWQSKIRKAPNRGFTGGRVDLIEHQLYLAQEVTSRLQPRVLLADEVGLGKTIEACLILHRLHLTGRAERALIILPESLMHQWFIELLRRFNLLASLFDEERCQAIEGADPESNPFLDSQIVCVSLDYLTRSHQRYSQVLDTDWDILIVDEAHHLEWTPQEASTAYQMVEGLAQKIPSVLLLTRQLALVFTDRTSGERLQHNKLPSKLQSETYLTSDSQVALHSDGVDSKLAELVSLVSSFATHAQTVEHIDVLVVHEQNNPKHSSGHYSPSGVAGVLTCQLAWRVSAWLLTPGPWV